MNNNRRPVNEDSRTRRQFLKDTALAAAGLAAGV